MAASPVAGSSLKEIVLTSWSRFKQLAADDGQDLIVGLGPNVDRLELGLFRIVVMGEIKKGKSSLVNALLGEANIVPTATDVATSAVTKLLYGPDRKFKVFFLPDVDTGRRSPPKLIEQHDLSRYTTESGNPNNALRVDFVGIELPSPLLRQGLVVVDTPGIGGLFRNHREVTWRYAPRADAVLFVIDSVEAVLSRDEIDFLRELTSKVTRRIVFVQTKTDAVDATQWPAWRDRNLAILSKELAVPPSQLPYFCVSNKLKQLADREHSAELLAESGFDQLLHFLHQGLLTAKETCLAQDIGHKLAQALGQLKRQVQSQRKIRSQTNSVELERQTRYCRQALEEFQQWERVTYQEALQALGDQFGDLRQHAQSRLQLELDPLGAIPKAALEAVRQQASLDAQAIVSEAVAIQQDCLARATEVYTAIHREFIAGVQAALSATAAKLAASVAVHELDIRPTTEPCLTVGDHEALKVTTHEFDDVRNTFYGGMAAFTMTQIGLGMVSLAIPIAAPLFIVAGVVAALAGGAEATRIASDKRREEALQKLQLLLQNLQRQTQQQALLDFSKQATQFERSVRDALKQAAHATRQQLERQLREVESTRAATLEQNVAQLRMLDNRLAEIEATQKTLLTAISASKPTSVAPDSAFNDA